MSNKNDNPAWPLWSSCGETRLLKLGFRGGSNAADPTSLDSRFSLGAGGRAPDTHSSFRAFQGSCNSVSPTVRREFYVVWNTSEARKEGSGGALVILGNQEVFKEASKAPTSQRKGAPIVLMMLPYVTRPRTRGCVTYKSIISIIQAGPRRQAL